MRISLSDQRKKEHGSGAVELLLAVPILLLLGLSGLQASLWFSAKFALNHAITEAARSGSVQHAEETAVLSGLAKGLTPWLFGAQDYADLISNEAKSLSTVQQGLADGWIVLQQLSPTHQSFDDWAIPAIDNNGNTKSGMLEIPNDNLNLYKTTRTPNSGVASYRGLEPIGVKSKQTLLDANTLKLNMTFGLAANVPIVGALTVRFLKAYYNCSQTVPTQERIGLITIENPATGSSTNTSAASASQLCKVMGAERSGAGRIPIQVSVAINMQSPARQVGWAIAQTATPAIALSGTSQGSPNQVAFNSASSSKPQAIAQVNPNGVGIGASVEQRQQGYTEIGSARTLADPALCQLP